MLYNVFGNTGPWDTDSVGYLYTLDCANKEELFKSLGEELKKVSTGDTMVVDGDEYPITLMELLGDMEMNEFLIGDLKYAVHDMLHAHGEAYVKYIILANEAVVRKS